jgi:hypothetical protein
MKYTNFDMLKEFEKAQILGEPTQTFKAMFRSMVLNILSKHKFIHDDCTYIAIDYIGEKFLEMWQLYNNFKNENIIYFYERFIYACLDYCIIYDANKTEMDHINIICQRLEE